MQRATSNVMDRMKFPNLAAESGSPDNGTATKRRHQKQRANAHLIAHITLQRKERAGGGSDKPLSPVNAQ